MVVYNGGPCNKHHILIAHFTRHNNNLYKLTKMATVATTAPVATTVATAVESAVAAAASSSVPQQTKRGILSVGNVPIADSKRHKVDPKIIKTDEEINAIIAPGMAKSAMVRKENENMVRMIEERTERDMELIKQIVFDKFGGDEKRGIMAFDAFKDWFNCERKKGLKGVLYNSKAVNEYVYDVTLPIADAFHDEAVRGAWHAGELKFGEDKRSWEEDLTDQERYFIKHTLAFFAAADAIVNDNIMKNFISESPLIEVVSVYATQLFVECIHNEVYGKLLKTYVTDNEELRHLFNAVNEIDVIKHKANWANRWISDSYASYGERLVAFACVEGLFFSGSFASIFWLKEKKPASGNQILPQLILSNEWISKDEGLHTRFAVMLHNHLEPDQQASENSIHEIVESATMLEIDFVTEALKVDLVQGMTASRMKQYICYTADVLLTQLGVKKLYNVENPFEFMSNIGLPMKSNFFEVKVTDYKKMGNINEKELSSETAVFAEIGSDDEDF